LPRPFQGIEEAAQELRKHLISSLLSVCQNKEEELRHAADVVNARREETNVQLIELVQQLEVDRDFIIEATSRRCQELVESLQRVAGEKGASLEAQQKALAEKADSLMQSRVAAEGVVKRLNPSEKPLELVKTCLGLIDRMGPIINANVITKPVSEANLRVVLSPLEEVVGKIMSRGWVGPHEVDSSETPLSSLILTTEDHHMTMLEAFLDFFAGKRFRCLYRASTDGWDPQSFHSKCDNQGPTVVLLKTSNSASIFGG